MNKKRLPWILGGAVVLGFLFNNCGSTIRTRFAPGSSSSLGTGGSPTPSGTPGPTATPTGSPTGTPTATPTPGGTPSTGQFFPSSAPWYRDVTTAPKDSQSDTIINWLAANGGWGTGEMRVDFSFHILTMDASTPFVPILKRPEYYLPDCDNIASFPLPVGGAIEGQTGYQCPEGDCHILVVDWTNRRLYENYISNVTGGQLQSQCAVVWDMNRNYPDTLRGEQCTSTDAAGFPIAPLLFTADEVAAGEIKHAIRFILPNPRMAARVYVRPATHAGGPSGPSTAVPYGARLRLKSSFNVNSLKPAARVVARAMQKYGILLADGGNIALTAASDTYTTAKWADLDFGPRDLVSLRVTDFEMIEAGARIPLTYDCVRNP